MMPMPVVVLAATLTLADAIGNPRKRVVAPCQARSVPCICRVSPPYISQPARRPMYICLHVCVFVCVCMFVCLHVCLVDTHTHIQACCRRPSRARGCRCSGASCSSQARAGPISWELLLSAFTTATILYCNIIYYSILRDRDFGADRRRAEGARGGRGAADACRGHGAQSHSHVCMCVYVCMYVCIYIYIYIKHTVKSS